MKIAENFHQKTSLIRSFLKITFGLMLIGWGSCAVLSQLLDWTVNHPVIRVLFVIGGFSPTVASYWLMRKQKLVRNFSDWLKQVFDVKHDLFTYACVFIFVAVYYILGCTINGFRIGAPVFMLFVIVPMMLFGGGNEEVGWRMILQPDLEKKTWLSRSRLDYSCYLVGLAYAAVFYTGNGQCIYELFPFRHNVSDP